MNHLLRFEYYYLERGFIFYHLMQQARLRNDSYFSSSVSFDCFEPTAKKIINNFFYQNHQKIEV